MITQGIQVKDYIFEEDSSGIIVVKNEIFHNTYTQQDYEDFLEELIEDGQMEQTTFKENKWVLISEFGSRHSVEFPFEFNQKVNDLLKKYVLFKIKVQNVTASHVHQACRTISINIQKTNFLHLNRLWDFVDETKDWSFGELRGLNPLREFLRFSQIENGKEYYEALASVPLPKSNSRMLPSYKSIMTFDYIINDFILNGSEELKLRYYPILIWWQLTKIVPLRPIELSLLKRDWLYHKDGSYFIRIERRKKKQGQISYQMIPLLTEVEIPEELFQLIHRYIELGKEFNDAPYILDLAFIVHNLEEGITFRTRTNFEFTDSSVLNRNLRLSFFEEIVRDQYGYEIVPKQEEELDYDSNKIEMIQMGDTRHIAICSMMLQGMNEFTIAQMAGHSNLTEQVGYCNHLDSYATAYTHRMAKSFQDSIRFNMSDPFEIKRLTEKQKISMSLLKHDLSTATKLDIGGYCKSEYFPFECEIDDCLFCPHFVGSRDMSQEMLEQKAETINRRIKTKMDYIKSVVGHKNDFIKDDEEAKINGKSLNTLFNRKAIVEAYMSQLRKD